jgi:hypothetical protein
MELSERIYKIRLRSTEYDDAVARVTELTVAELLAARASDATMIELFGSHLLDWNLTKNGEPVPATPEGVASIGGNLAMSLAVQWLLDQGRPLRDRPIPPSDLELNGAGAGVEMETL